MGGPVSAEAGHQLGAGNQKARARVSQEVFDLSGLVELVDDDGDAARTGHAKEGGGFGAPGKEDGDPVAATETGAGNSR